MIPHQAKELTMNDFDDTNVLDEKEVLLENNKESDMNYPTYSNYSYHYTPYGTYYSYWGYYPYHSNREI